MMLIKRFLFDDSGPTAVEYAVMLALIVGACFATIMLLGQETFSSFNGSANKINQAASGGS